MTAGSMRNLGLGIRTAYRSRDNARSMPTDHALYVQVYDVSRVFQNDSPIVDIPAGGRSSAICGWLLYARRQRPMRMTTRSLEFARKFELCSKLESGTCADGKGVSR